MPIRRKVVECLKKETRYMNVLIPVDDLTEIYVFKRTMFRRAK